MKGGVVNIGKFTKQDSLKASRKAARQLDLSNSTGWCQVLKVHKSPKDYTRKPKHRLDIFD